MTTSILDQARLETGSHTTRETGVCAMELVAWLAGEPHTDHPTCSSPVLAAFVRTWNDALGTEDRQRLKPYLPRLIGTADDGADGARAWLATDWLVRTCAPAWLQLAELDEPAEALRDLPPLTPETTKMAQPTITEARRNANAAWAAAGAAAGDAAAAAAWAAAWDAAGAAAGDAARAAARDAARAAARAAARDAARAAAWDAARDAAWAAARAAAWAAARDAARAAARDAAGDAAGAAARAAARDAARAAARDAARAAARAALAPTVATLQSSAFDLLDQMITAGRDAR